MEKIQFKMNKLYQLFKVPSCCIDKNGKMMFKFGIDFTSDAYYQNKAKTFFEQQGKTNKKRPLIETSEDDSIYMGYYFYDGNVYIFGPAVYYLTKDAMIERFCIRVKAGFKKEHLFLSEYNYFYQITILASILISGEYIDDEYTDMDSDDFERDLSKDLSDIDDYQLKISEYNLTNVSRAMERELIKVIKSGDEKLLFRFFNKSIDALPKMGKMASKPLKQYEYMSVIGVSLAARAAIESGVNDRKAYDINDVFLQKIEKCHNVLKYFKLVAEAATVFTRLVKEEKRKRSTTIYVDKAIEYIEHNLTKPLTCRKIASYIGLNSDYLSKIFIIETSQSIKKFIQKERVDKACNLLKYSEMPIQEIATFLSFPSHSYFGKVFKEFKDITPNQYRIKRQNLDR